MKAMDRRSALKLGAVAAMTPVLAQLVACGPGGGSGGGSANPTGPITLENIRDFVVGIDEPVELEDGSTRTAICFDNAATTPALVPVMNAVADELRMYGSIGRGFSQKSDHSTELYEATREKALSFLGADPETYTCFYANSATDGLNKLASALVESEKTVVLTTRLEHHSNLLPWRERCKVICAEMDDQGRIIYEDFEKQLKENKVDYVTVTAASNVTGYVTDVHRVAKLAHAHGAKIVVDGAQIVAHRAFSMVGETPEENIDFFAFSAHKMYSPFGGGAVVGLTEVLNEHMPEFYGGGTVRIVADDWVTYKEPPESYEAGSPNYPGVVGLGKAIEVLQEVGFDAIQEHEQALVRKMVDGLLAIDNIVIYGDTEDTTDRVGVVSFNTPDINTHVLAKRLASSYAVATRRGAFCAHPYVWRLMNIPDNDVRGFLECVDVNTAGMLRVSFGIYNTEEEVEEFLQALPEAIKLAQADAEFYSRAEPAY
ncbi:MAG: aminotransferase class V-fold PLP-dependent enzyme [Coriobacteriia bacterium]|nr:aminotransferase class V-fold PLP-dependent enzyme [Coriobacteriia bacterium]